MSIFAILSRAREARIEKTGGSGAVSLKLQEDSPLRLHGEEFYVQANIEHWSASLLLLNWRAQFVLLCTRA